MTIPSTQKAGERPISFMLYDDGAGDVVSQVDMVIRPEELTRREPSRITEHNALGGAWVDDFGQGIAQIEINGHTGWRGSKDRDGAAIFQALHQDIFGQWHTMRRDRAAQGKDPDLVQMVFSDELNGHSDVVVPKLFTLRRQKSRPLLKQYQIAMVVLGDVGATALEQKDPIVESVSNPYGRYQASSISLSANIREQTELAKDVDELLGGITDAANAVMETSNELLGAVLEVGAEVTGTFDAVTAPLLYTSMAFQRAARNAFYALITPYGVLENAKYTLMKVASNFNEGYCTLLNGFNILRQFPDIEQFFGASSCSSTGGGRPLSPFQFDNPFQRLYRSGDSGVSVSGAGAQAMAELNQDVLSLSGTSDITRRMQDMADGVRLT